MRPRITRSVNSGVMYYQPTKNKGNSMYFWNTKKLASDIKNNLVKAEDWKNYYLLPLIFASIFSIFENTFPVSLGLNLNFIYLSEILYIGIFIFGINITFKSNLKKSGESYVARITALGFPIGVKLISASILIIFIAVIVISIFHFGKDFKEWFSLTLTCVMEIIFFWRINVYLKFINT